MAGFHTAACVCYAGSTTPPRGAATSRASPARLQHVRLLAARHALGRRRSPSKPAAPLPSVPATPSCSRRARQTTPGQPSSTTTTRQTSILRSRRATLPFTSRRTAAYFGASGSTASARAISPGRHSREVCLPTSRCSRSASARPTSRVTHAASERGRPVLVEARVGQGSHPTVPCCSVAPSKRNAPGALELFARTFERTRLALSCADGARPQQHRSARGASTCRARRRGPQFRARDTKPSEGRLAGSRGPATNGRARIVRYLFWRWVVVGPGRPRVPGSLSAGGSRAQNVDVSALHDPPDLRSSTSRSRSLAGRRAVCGEHVCVQHLA